MPLEEPSLTVKLMSNMASPGKLFNPSTHSHLPSFLQHMMTASCEPGSAVLGEAVKKGGKTLAGWFSGWSVFPIHQKGCGFDSREGTYLGCRFKPQWRHVWEANRSMFLSHIDVSLSLPLSLKSINISSDED